MSDGQQEGRLRRIIAGVACGKLMVANVGGMLEVTDNDGVLWDAIGDFPEMDEWEDDDVDPEEA